MRCTACHLRRPLFEQAHLIPRQGQFFSPLCEQRSRQVGFSIIFLCIIFKVSNSTSLPQCYVPFVENSQRPFASGDT